jgi:methylthioribose-1-phosphate isomerase
MKSWPFVLIFVWIKGIKSNHPSMRIHGEHYQTIWIDEHDPHKVVVIDQQKLPFSFSTKTLASAGDVYHAIKEMTVRGAPLIGVTGAFGLYLSALHASPGNWRDEVQMDMKKIASSRPTAINLTFALDRVWMQMQHATEKTGAVEKALNGALELLDEERENCRKIGEHGVEIIASSYRKKGSVVNILTHCNAGWLACIDYGTATAPVYMAHDLGIPVHVWVDETRPRNQGARLTAFELGEHGVPYTIVTDNAGGHLMQHGMVDLVIVGSDRTTARGDVANKIGTYLKALAARDNGVPFYVALPTSSIDYSIGDGIKEIPIEERDEEEVLCCEGTPARVPAQARDDSTDPSNMEGQRQETEGRRQKAEEEGRISKLRIAPEGARAANYGFDVTPAELVMAYITEKGVWREIEGKSRK